MSIAHVEGRSLKTRVKKGVHRTKLTTREILGPIQGEGCPKRRVLVYSSGPCWKCEESPWIQREAQTKTEMTGSAFGLMATKRSRVVYKRAREGGKPDSQKTCTGARRRASKIGEAGRKKNAAGK